MRYLLFLMLLGCGAKGVIPLDPAPQCAHLPYLGRWIGSEVEDGLYLDKNCWGTVRRCQYFFSFSPPSSDGDSMVNIKVTEGIPGCLGKGEVLGTFKQHDEGLDFRLGDSLLRFKRE